MILAGDIGGTKADLALFERGGDPRHPRLGRRIPTREHASLGALLEAFLDEAHERPERAVFGIAGPVKNNRCEATNLPWLVDGNALGEHLGTRVTLINDLATTAWGVSQLAPEDLEILHPGEPTDATRALIAAGTGLGESIMARTEDGWIAVPSEGGHADFAPRNPLEDELLQWLRAKYSHVSYERVLSGPGIADLYRFMTDLDRGQEPPEVAQRFAGAPDPAVVVTETALDGSCERSRRVLETFTDIYGSEAGNLALKALAQGGVYVGGGIAPRILPFLRGGRFARGFQDKGRLTPVLEQIPLAVILDPRTSLWGAAAFAMTHP
jgi:glucokinase